MEHSKNYENSYARMCGSCVCTCAYLLADVREYSTHMHSQPIKAGRYRPTSIMSFEWHFAGGPIVARFYILIFWLGRCAEQALLIGTQQNLLQFMSKSALLTKIINNILMDRIRVSNV